MRRLVLLLCLLPLFAAALPTAPAAAADSKRLCFAQVPDCIEFRFRTFWSGNGGLPVFGLPLSPDRTETVGGQKYKVQYFERFRFEQHKENQAPYDVLLGRIGVDRLAAQGRDWQTFPKADPSAPHYFAQTGHAIDAHFWGFWSSNGLEFDGNKKAKSPAESLALFGYPISEAQMEQGSDGQMYLTQWFERARFEFHPENKAPYDVLLGRLGADALAAAPAPQSGGPKPAPVLAIGCPENAPAPAEGPQAWVANPQPDAPGSINTLCVRLTVGGAPAAGAQVVGVAHFNYGDLKIGPSTTGADGQARIDFNIDKARNRFVVTIDVTFKAADGQSYTVATNFRPRYPSEEPPPITGVALQGIPAPTGNCAANAPAPVEGAQAWMTNIQPTDPNQFNSVCSRLIVNSQVVPGAKVHARAYRPGHDEEYGPATTDATGVAEIGFPIGGTRSGSIVFMEVTLEAPGGQSYVAITYYRPNYPNP
jgi:hypothetical protein